MYSFLICNRMLVMRDKECVLILVLFRKRKRTQEDLAQEESPGQLCGREPGPCEVGKYSKTTQVVFESSIPIDREILKS